MRRKETGVLSALAVSTCATVAWAEVPKVVVDMAPLHGIVARVMDGAGAPDLVLRPGASPHGYAMRPSEAAMLQNADVIFHIGADLAPWLEEAVETLAADAQVFEMMELDGTTQLPYREYTVLAESHDDHDDHEGHDDHKDHDDHEDHADHKDHDDHAGHDGHDHAHGDVDPHGWLDPKNAALWMTFVSQTLAEADPDNAGLYRENATRGIKEIKAAVATVEEQLFAHQKARFIVFHDAYQYFEGSFGMQVTAALAPGDAAAPGAGRVAAIRNLIVDQDVSCIFSEPQFSPKFIETVRDGSDVDTAVIDPLGAEITPGPQFYPTLLTRMADGMATCFDGS